MSEHWSRPGVSNRTFFEERNAAAAAALHRPAAKHGQQRRLDFSSLPFEDDGDHGRDYGAAWSDPMSKSRIIGPAVKPEHRPQEVA